MPASSAVGDPSLVAAHDYAVKYLGNLKTYIGEVKKATSVRNTALPKKLSVQIEGYDKCLADAQRALEQDPELAFSADFLKPLLSRKVLVDDIVKGLGIKITIPPFEMPKEGMPNNIGSRVPIPEGSPKPPPKREDVTASLLKEYDKLNAFWKQAERELAGLHTPVFCCVSLWSESEDERDPNPRYYLEHSLAWEKVGKDWRLCYGVYADYEGPDHGGWTPISDCTLDIRVRAVEGFEKLRTVLKEASTDYLDKVRKANETMAALLSKR